MDQVARRIMPLLPVLAAVAESGQATTAAQRLGIPQSTVSRNLARLGAELGTPVVERHGRGLRLTRAGEALAPHAQAAVAAAEVGTEAVRVLEPGAKGTIRLAFQTTLGDRVVPALVKRFRREYPGVTFELTQALRADSLVLLRAREVDFTFISPIEEAPGLDTLLLHTEPLVLIVPRGHRVATAQSVSLRDVADEPFITTKQTQGMYVILHHLAASAGFTPHIEFEANDLPTIRGLVSAGLGVGLGPRDPYGAREFVEIPLVDDGAVRRIGVSWRAEEPSTLDQAFQDMLRTDGTAITEAGLRPY